MILAHLDRKTLAVGSNRRGLLSTTPDRAFHGHMVCLINRQGAAIARPLPSACRDSQIDFAVKDLMDKIAKDPRDLAPKPPIPPRPLVPIQ